tara:strand:- start:126 stop:446 length:321 start_codon:yes stop_codon:yes gene_type:complete
MKHIVNGQLVDMTESEIQEYNERNTAWNNASADRKLEQIKQMRLERLRETDWMSNSDVTMPDYVKTWRQTLRDLPQNNTTESQYDTLLEQNADGSLKNSVWTQPTE